MAKRHLTQYDSEGRKIPIYIEANEVDVNGRPLDEVIGEGVYDPQYVHTDNNYTTAEKNKLAGLRNYDDTDVQTAIRNINDAIDRLTGTSDTTEIIDTMNEVIDFLSGLDNTDSLANELVSIRQQLANKLNAGNAYNKHQVDDLLDAKQDIINDLVTIRNGARLGATAVQTETDPTVPSWAKQPRKPTYTAAEVGALPANTTIPQGTVTAVKVNDGQPVYPNASGVVSLTISASGAQVQPDWDETNTESPAYIQNKPNVANAISVNQHSYVMNNNHAFVIPDYYTKTEVDDKVANAGKVKSVTINGKKNLPDGETGDVDLGTIQGQKGDKGETGNVQVDGNGNVLIVNNLEEGGTGAALSAEMGKRLALLAGTYAEAWARSKAITVPFCWLWVETVNGAAISKPIWHKGNSVFVDATGAIINVPAASVPDAPTITGASNGSTVAKNTQITITPAGGSALYYSIDGGSTYQTSDSAVTLTLATAGSVSIVAYCANNAGNSSNASLSVTVAGTAVPTFSQASGEVARGGSVTISVPAGGELHYKVDSGSWITASGTSVSIPITGATTIQAYNVQDGDTSSTITNNYTMAALASPTFSVATGTEFPATGGSVKLTGPTGADIYYTTNGDTPTASSTKYTGTAIAVNAAMTIKAIAHDTYGDSAVAEASYTVAQPKIIVTATDATTMSLGETGLTELTINAGTNEFTPADLGITTFADHVFPSLSFGDVTKIITFDGGGLQVNSLDNAFLAHTTDGTNPTLTKCVGIVLAGQDAHAYQAFRDCTYLTECELSGVVNGSMNNTFYVATGMLTAIDISGLSGHVTNCSSMFFGVGCEVIDVSQLTFTKDKAASMFRNCSKLKTIKVGKLEMETANLINLMFYGTSGVTTVICTETTPYTTGWLDTLNGQHALTAIYVPDASVNDYKAHSEWGTYASIIQGISNYTE